ncbi:MAG TPA: response regulator transcription factor [Flavobacteriia bacterium]|jgi:two-component system alkaline phosphatase synthesis response regulator PhoP|nr:response regulator transcription factor [Flavobacteriia bacterium]
MNVLKHILLVDDEPDILEILSYNFKQDGYQVLTASNGREAIDIAIKEEPKIILLDVMMPDLDGMETCRLLRENPTFEDTLILFFTARGEDYSEIAGFEAGADDYIKKTIRPRTLLVRINSLLKRKYKNSITETLQLGNLQVQVENRKVILDGEPISLPKKEYEILKLFMYKPNKVFKREEIYRKVWGSKIVVGERTLDVHIRKLRKKLNNSFIKTSKGIGYYIEVN